MFEQSVGNVTFYKQICNGLNLERQNKTSGLEDFLWRALESALQKDGDREVMIVVDGLNHAAGGETGSKALFDRLHTTCTKTSNTKCVILTQPPSKPFSKPARQFVVKDEHTHDDILHYIHQTLGVYHHFHDRNEEEKQKLVYRLADHVKGNYIFAELLIESLKKETTHNGFTQAMSTLPKSIAETIKGLVSRLDAAKSSDSLIVSWLLAAERPMTLAEIHCLLETRIGNEKPMEKISDIEGDVRERCGSLCVIEDEIVRFRHISIRKFMLENSQSEVLPMKEAQRDLVTRCLAYVKYRLTGRGARIEPSMDAPESRVVSESFQKYQLLEYTVRYWTTHFRASTMFDPHGAHKTSSDFTQHFPESVSFALLEWTCWNSQSWLREAAEMHLFALELRKTILKEHQCVLQSLTIMAITYEKLSNFVEASTFYYQASKLAQTIVGRFSTIATSLATAFLKCTATITITERTEIVTRKEEMILFIITTEEHHHGCIAKEIISYKKMLATLYLEIKETNLAIKIQHEIYRACVEFYGELHSETIGVYGNLIVILHDGFRGEDWEEHILTMFAVAERTMKLLDRKRIDATVGS